MAQIPTDDEVTKAQLHAQRAIKVKQAMQAKQGKEFVIDEHGHAAGVIPEKVWKSLKPDTDEAAK